MLVVRETLEGALELQFRSLPTLQKVQPSAQKPAAASDVEPTGDAGASGGVAGE